LSRSIGVLPFLESHGRVIHNGVDPAESNSAPAVNTGQAVARYILCTAAFNPIKAQDILLQAFARIQHLDPSLRVQLIGDGERREALQALASELGVVDRVEFLGWQDHESVLKHVGQCEVLVLPTRSEGLPIAVLEGMLAGKPVIATAVGGIPEQITDGEDGLLVPVDDPQALADALSRVLSDRQLAGRLGQAAMDKVHRCFTVERTADAYEGLFRELLTDRS
jgi:glycosyltransferase involved in cell wall biosynthesis